MEEYWRLVNWLTNDLGKGLDVAVHCSANCVTGQNKDKQPAYVGQKTGLNVCQSMRVLLPDATFGPQQPGRCIRNQGLKLERNSRSSHDESVTETFLFQEYEL